MDVSRALVRLSPQDLADRSSRRRWEICRRVALIRFLPLPLLILPVLVLSSPSVARWARCLAARISGLCRCGMQRRASWDRPALRGPAPPHPTPTPSFPVLAAPPVSYFGILCLNNSFCLFHFKFSPLTERLAAEDWLAAHGRSLSLAV